MDSNQGDSDEPRSEGEREETGSRTDLKLLMLMVLPGAAFWGSLLLFNESVSGGSFAYFLFILTCLYSTHSIWRISGRGANRLSRWGNVVLYVVTFVGVASLSIGTCIGIGCAAGSLGLRGFH